MSEDFLVNASTEGLRPLGTAPQRSFELISGTVDARLGEAHAALFAEPVSSEHGDRYDWYAGVSGAPRRLRDLPEDQRDKVRAELDRLVADIRALAATLAASDKGDDQRLGEALENALEVPGEDSIWVIAGLPGDRLQPVLVNWAWVQDRQEAVRGVLSGADTRSRAPIAAGPALGGAAASAQTGSAAAAAPQDGRAAADAPILLWWLLGLGWLILAALIAAILYLAIEACALRIPGLPGRCPIAATATESAAARTRLVLEDQILQMERRIGIADRACQPQPAQAVELPPLQPAPPPPAIDLPPLRPAPPPPAPEPPSEADTRMRESGAQLGDLTFTLIWDSPDDLDLHVSCPGGGTVYYRQPRACGGALDVDSNANHIVPRPIENVFFDNPARGAYHVQVHYYGTQTGWQPRPFELQIRDQDRVETLSGMVSSAQRTWSATHQTRGQ